MRKGGTNFRSRTGPIKQDLEYLAKSMVIFLRFRNNLNLNHFWEIFSCLNFFKKKILNHDFLDIIETSNLEN